MMRINVVETNAQCTSLLVEGQVVQEWARLLELEIQNALNRSTVVLVDLASVTATDRAANRMLRRFVDNDVRIINRPRLLEFEEADP